MAVKKLNNSSCLTLSLSGPATARRLHQVIPALRETIAAQKQIFIDFSNSPVIDARFLGLMIMLRKSLKDRGRYPRFIGLTLGLKRIFRLGGLGFVLSADTRMICNGDAL